MQNNMNGSPQRVPSKEGGGHMVATVASTVATAPSSEVAKVELGKAKGSITVTRWLKIRMKIRSRELFTANEMTRPSALTNAHGLG